MSLIQKVRKLNKIIKHRKQLNYIISTYLFFLENAEKSVWGSITEEDEEGIKHAVVLSNEYEGSIVEIGTLFGHTTNLLASLKRIDVPLIAVENFSGNPFHLPQDVHRQFTRRTLRYVLDHCSTQIFDGDAADFYSANKTLRPSLVFIDAGHEYEMVRQDIEWAVSTGCPVISGHDYIDIHPGVVKAVDETFGEKISLYGSVWIHQNHER
jgi:Methyltransferase domain